MNNKIARLVALAALAVWGANATEMRSPYLSERGPLRYTFEKDDPDRYSLSIYSGLYSKNANKAFMKHGTNTHALSALFFNKADFDTKEFLPDSDMPIDSEYYNPFIKLGKMQPRITYYEEGVNLGGRFEYPIYKDKGRIGVRANIPFKTIEIERENFSDKYEDPIRHYRLDSVIDIGGVVTAVRSYRFDFINEMWYIDPVGKREPAVAYGSTGGTDQVRIFGNQVQAKDLSVNKQISTGDSAGKAISVGLIQHDNPDTRPVHYATDGPFLGFNAKDDVDWDLAPVAPATQRGPSYWINKDHVDTRFAANQGWDAAKEISFFTAKDPSNVAVDYSTLTPDPDWLKTKWTVFGYDTGVAASSADTILKGADSWTRQFSDNPYYWFTGRSFEFETDRRTGFGDIDLDLFYEHTFSDEWVGEVMLGLRFPTGSNDDYYGNPYRVHLGNGEHWEIKFGGMIAWMPLDWMNVKLDARYAVAIEATEQRCAGFKGATIKNIGPQVAADMDWQYFIANLDFTFFHPKTDDLSTVIGYEFYYKTKDDVTQKVKQKESWLGKKWAQVGAAGAYGWRDNPKDLDDSVLAMNTQSISHKVRSETSYRFSDWFELYGGGAFVFAGKNIPREGELHGGCNVRF